MAKKRTRFVCQSCGFESAKWMGKCPECGEWNSLVEEIQEEALLSTPKSKSVAIAGKAMKISDIEIRLDHRTRTDMQEFDRVLGGGIVDGSLVLVGGDPGIGKSTLLLQISHLIAKKNKKVLYISGEESQTQIKMRADRLDAAHEKIVVLSETDLEVVEEIIADEQPDIIIADSVQTLYVPTISSAPGSVSQVREVTNFFMKVSKMKGMTTFIIGHVTKQGAIAGPRVLEHMVDTVLYFEGDNNNIYRVLRAVKNRFGSTNEIGIFEMTQLGLMEVPNPSETLLQGRPIHEPGSVIVASIEGTRPMLIEIQALVTPAVYGNPRRLANGLDYNRVSLLMAVMEKKTGFQAYSYDAYVNITGGIQIKEPALDLGLVLAIMSSLKEKPVSEQLTVVGEVGLSGEIRAVSQIEPRIIEAEKMGFKKIIIPRGNLKQKGNYKIEIIEVDSLNAALTSAFEEE